MPNFFLFPLGRAAVSGNPPAFINKEFLFFFKSISKWYISVCVHIILFSVSMFQY